MTNVAIIGAGAISSSHIEAYLTFPERCRIVAMVDIDPEKAERQVAKYGLNVAVADDYRKVLDGHGVDLVSVCTSPGTHAEIASGVLSAGVNALVEKPMAASPEECDTIIAAAETEGALLSVVAQNRFTTPMMRLKAVLDAGLVGKVLHAQVDSYWWRGHTYYDLWWRGTWEDEGGGCTLNHAVHHIDLLQWMTGMPVQIQAMLANVAHDNAEVEDVSIAMMRFPSGGVGQLTSSVVHHGQEQQLVFQGEKAKVAAPWQVYASKSRANGFPDRDTAAEAEIQAFYDQLPTVTHEGHTGQIEDVLGALDRKRQVLIDGYEGRKTLEIISAIYKSAVIGGPVSLPLAGEDPYRTKEGLLMMAPRFHEKVVSVTDFAENDITTSGQ
jgi:predicted dehydrogenase